MVIIGCPILLSPHNENDVFLLLGFKFVSTLLSTAFLLSRKKICFSYFEIFCTAGIFLTAIINSKFSIEFLFHTLYIFYFYVGLKSLVQPFLVKDVHFFLLNTLAFLLITLFSFSIFYFYNYDELSNTFFSINSSIFSIFLAAIILILLALVYEYKGSFFLKYFYWVGICTAILLLAATHGRAGWLCCIIGVCFIYYKNLRLKIQQKPVLLFSTIVISTIFCLSFFYKQGSTSGRLLIQKISFRIFKDNWLFVIGQGQFKVQYNLAQAEYFSFNSIDTKEALLADNTFYAFNDYFQFVIEYGLLGIFIVIGFLYFYIKHLRSVTVTDESKPLFLASQSSLICIFVGAFFSYCLQSFAVNVLLLLALVVINGLSVINKNILYLNNLQVKFFKILFIATGCLLCSYFCYAIFYEQKSKTAFEYNQIGFKTKSLKEYKKINDSYVTIQSAQFYYAEGLYNVNKLEEAKVVLNKLKKIYTANDLYVLSAKVEAELNNLQQAAQDYRKAIYIVPNRMRSRKNLLDFYLQQKDTANAIYWANSILNMPIKVRSNITDTIHAKTTRILSQISK